MKRFALLALGIFAVSIALVGSPSDARADHDWTNSAGQPYHWARTTNPFTLKLGDNVSGAWDASLGMASSDWTTSSVLDTVIVPGATNPKVCRASTGRVEVCNSKYGSNGWLGVAQIWISGGTHITAGTVKLNDTYFNTAAYNTPAWRNLVMCQEIGHTFGLNHQDETFGNTNLNTCMDYTSDPGTNQQPNAHDYEMLASIYSHLDSTTTVAATTAKAPANGNLNDPGDWGRLVSSSVNGKAATFEKDLGNGMKVLTHVFYAE